MTTDQARPETATQVPAYFEDFVVGASQVLGTFTVDKDEVMAFARRYDPQPFHTDEAVAAQSAFGGLVASGWHTCAMAMRVMVDGYLSQAAGGGSPGIESLQWLQPVRPGDVITVARTTVQVKPSRSKPDRGMVLSDLTLTNQAGVLVMRMQGWGMFFTRASTVAHAARR